MTPRLLPCTIGVLAALCIASLANAQLYVSGFETVKAAAAGTALNGQDSYYLPTVTTSSSITFNVYTYSNNSLKIPQNPTGAKQFVGCTGPGRVNNVITYCRSQRNVTYIGDMQTAGFDI